MTGPKPPVTDDDRVDWSDFPARRAAIFEGAKNAFADSFPQSYGGVELSVHDLHYADPEHYTKKEAKDALLHNRFLHRRLRGTLRLRDEKTGELLDQRELTALKVPYLTDAGSFVHGGSEITTVSQARLMPGAYTRRKANAELETHFNSRRGTGGSFRVSMDPATGVFRLNAGQATIKLFPLLRDMGVPDGHLKKLWGDEVFKKNEAEYDSRALDKAHAKLVRRAEPGKSRPEKAAELRAALEATMLSRETLSRTLPNALKT
jgi:DNA-directed RNA polymerase beta subunit